jgi:hypothetical protein
VNKDQFLTISHFLLKEHRMKRAERAKNLKIADFEIVKFEMEYNFKDYFKEKEGISVGAFLAKGNTNKFKYIQSGQKKKKTCEWCKKEFMAVSGQRYCSRECSNASSYHTRKQAKKPLTKMMQDPAILDQIYQSIANKKLGEAKL